MIDWLKQLWQRLGSLFRSTGRCAFFFGRNVFIAIEGQNTPGGTGPYTAYYTTLLPRGTSKA
jgi:hypothetical protein